ncbi:MAG: HEAT repeat domain-containing protein [Planctomycetota bacterium]
MKNTFFIYFGLIFLFAFLAGYVGTHCVTVIAQENDPETENQIRELFRKGKDAFYEGRYDAAIDLFEQVLALRPSHELALELRKEAGFQFFVEGLAKEGDLGFILRKFLEIIEKPPVIDRPQNETIQKYLELMKSEDYQTKYMAIENILAEVGQYVCPFCVETLGDRRKDNFRTDIIVLLWRMGQDAVLPVIEILNSSDSFTRQNAAIVLGHIGDPRAIAALKTRIEDTQEDQHVKNASVEALKKITKMPRVEDLELAKKTYVRLGEMYYYDDPAIVVNNYKEWLYWFWLEDEENPENKLAYRAVDRWEYNELLAEEACYESLTLDPDLDEAWTLLLCVYYSELNEVQSALEVMLERQREGGFSIPDYAVEKFRQRREINEKCSTINYTRGRRQLYKALRRSLDDGNSLNSVSCIQAICELKDNGFLVPDALLAEGKKSYPDISMVLDNGTIIKGKLVEETEAAYVLETPQGRETVEKRKVKQTTGPQGSRDNSAAPLIAALNYPDKRVRYAAADALVRINPDHIFLDHDKVIPTLIEALGESAVRVILIIESDEQIANRMVTFVREIGYMPVLEKDGLSGLTRIKRFPTQDIVIVATDLPDYKAFEIIDAMKEDYRSKDIPVFVMCPELRLRETSALYAGRADDVIEKKVNKLVLRDKLDAAFQTPKARVDAPARAIQVAKSAAEALAVVDLENPNFELTQMIRPLEEAIMKGTTDEPRRLDFDVVRLPAMVALGRLGTDARSTLDTLCAVFSNKNNKKEIRCGAADAIGEICRPTGEGTPMVLAALSEGLGDAELEVQRSGAKALGKCSNWTGLDYFSRMFVPQRVHKNEKE